MPTLHEQVRAAIISDEKFLTALKQLSIMVKVEYGAAMLAGFSRYLESLEAKRFDHLDTLPAVYIMPIVIALRHVQMGTPLYMSDELLEDWVGDDQIAECQSCGYRQPARHRSCVLCDSDTGDPGVWARMRARSALSN